MVLSWSKLSLIFCILKVVAGIIKVTMSSSASVPTDMKAVKFTPGGPENLSTEQVPVPVLRQREVLIEVYKTAINRADTLQRKGLYPPPAGESHILGLEATGQITQLGPGCSNKWKVGDRVTALLAGGGNAEYVAAHEDLLMPVEPEMSWSEAAAIPEVWLTAYQLLHTVGRLEKTDTVLIHAGGSGVGTAAIQLVKAYGAKAIVTAGSMSKINTALQLGADHGFNYKELDGKFAEKVSQVTEGKGVNLILDCIGASYYEENVASIATDGRWVVYGLMGGANISGDILSKILRKRITITGSTLRARSIEYKGELVNKFTSQALPSFKTGQLKTIIDKQFTLDEISAAHKYMEDNKNTGKIIIQVKAEIHDEL